MDTALIRIKQDKQRDGTDTNPHAANQHGCNYQKAPLPLGQPPPAVAQTWRDCDGVQCRHSVPIHDLSDRLNCHITAMGVTRQFDRETARLPGEIWQERIALLRRKLFTRVRSAPATI